MSVPLRVDDFDYELPPDLVAQGPLPSRDASRLMVVDRAAGAAGLPRHMRFSDLPGLLEPGDLLVLNDTRVVPARLVGRRAAPGTGGRVEALLLEKVGKERAAEPGEQVWRALLKGARRPGEALDFGGGLAACVVRRDGEEAFLIELSAGPGPGTVEEALQKAGRMPTPPYIRRLDGAGPEGRDPREAIDRARYQTVFARSPGAVAAPTAGLHFTFELLEAARVRGVAIETLTLHVGPGTFLPVRAERVEEHRMHPEAFSLPERLASAVDRARASKRRVVAVGTTVTRALEARAAPGGGVLPGEGRCDLFIYPGHRFRVVDALLTNFHLPRSTLLMLVAAFAGRERVLAAYEEAIAARYRFYSYGDAMLVL